MNNQNEQAANVKHLVGKRVRNLVGGAALAVSLIFGASTVLPAITHAQTATTPAASQTAPVNGQNQTAPNPPTGGPGPRGGGGGKGGPRHDGLSGTISAVSGDSITLKQANSIVITATVNSSTVYDEAGKTISLSDLKIGELVQLREAHNSDGTVSVAGVEVVLNRVGGTISAINSDTLTLTRADNSTIKVTVSATTSYTDLGQSSSLSNLKVGTQIDAAGMLSSDSSTLTAQVVNVQHARLGGTVTAINGNTITVQVGGPGAGGKGRGPGMQGPDNQNGAPSSATPATGTTTAANATTVTKTIVVSGSTSYQAAGQTSQLSNIAVGDHIDAAGTLSSDGNTIQALQVSVRLPGYRGTVTAVNGSTITLQDRGVSRTIVVSGSTKYLNGTASAALSDIKTGANLEAEGQLDSTGKLTAVVVQLGQPQPPAQGGPEMPDMMGR